MSSSETHTSNSPAEPDATGELTDAELLRIVDAVEGTDEMSPADELAAYEDALEQLKSFFDNAQQTTSPMRTGRPVPGRDADSPGQGRAR